VDVFISWSGDRSRAAADALRDWLPKIINAVRPWLSSADIDKGARWNVDIAAKLEAAKIGILCLTPWQPSFRLDSLRGWSPIQETSEYIRVPVMVRT
jgi:TIR domain